MAGFSALRSWLFQLQRPALRTLKPALSKPAEAEIDSAIEEYRASRVALAAEVARHVVLIRAVDRDIELVESTIEADRDALDIAQSHSATGFNDELDVARARRDLESNLALLPSLTANRREAEFRLAALLGEVPGTITVGRRSPPRRDVVPGFGLSADPLMRRPDLRRAERELDAATARTGAAEAERFLRVTLQGSIPLRAPDLGDVVNADAFVLQAGGSISTPVFQGGRIRSQVLEAESELRRALVKLRASVIDALGEVETATMRRAKAEERSARLSDAEAAARDAENLSSDRHTAGQVDFLDVTEARRSRLAIERSRVAAERDANFRLVDLYASLGGGGQPTTVRSTGTDRGRCHSWRSVDELGRCRLRDRIRNPLKSECAVRPAGQRTSPSAA